MSSSSPCFQVAQQSMFGNPQFKLVNWSLWCFVGTGAVAGGVTGILTTPFDVLKTRLMTQASPLLRKAELRLTSPGGSS